MFERIFSKSFFILTILFLVLLYGIFLKINDLQNKYEFNWDQESDAYKVMSIIEDRKPALIGPRAVSDTGFFVGPNHYYFLVPFYLIAKGDPIAGAYAAIVVSILTVIVGYWVSFKLYGSKVALVAAFFLASSVNVTSWNVMYIKLMSIGLFFLCYKWLSEEKYFYPIMFLLGAMLTTHGSAIPAVLVVFTILLIKRKYLKFKKVFVGFLFFVVPFIPLIVFDFRHNFLNFIKVIDLLNGGQTLVDGGRFLFLRTFWRAVSFIDIPITNSVIYFTIRLLGLISVLVLVIKEKQTAIRLLILTFILSPLIILFFYRGNIPEYYYGVMTALLPIFVAKYLWEIPLAKLFVFISVIFILHQVLSNRLPPVINLAQKKAVVSYLVNQERDKYFNVSYDLPLGWDNGYEYLFKYYKRIPDRSERGHLYSIVTLPTDQGGELVYQNGILGVIRR